MVGMTSTARSGSVSEISTPLTATRRARADRRVELAAFLRKARERVTPADAGIAPGVRRKTPGLRREEVAQLAGVGITWYTWLEQGRPINVSIQVLDAIARVLRMQSAERWYLYRLADVPGVPAPASPTPLPSDAVAVLDQLDPVPACIYNTKYDLQACNLSYAALFPGLATATGLRRNALWRLANARPEDPTDLGRDAVATMISNLRANYAQHVGDPEWVQLIDSITATSPEMARIWADHQVTAPRPMVKVFRREPVGIIELNTVSYAIEGVTEARMVIYLPRTAQDAERIHRLRAATEQQSTSPRRD